MPQEGFSAAGSFFKVLAGIYVTLALFVILYGIVSVLKQKTSILGDDGSSHFNLLRPRLVPRSSQTFEGDAAKAMGWIYILIGVFMIAPAIWAYFSLK